MKKYQPYLLLTLFLVVSAACSKKEETPAQAAAAKKPPVPAVVQIARSEDFPVESSQIGTLEAVQSVPLKAQIGGTVVAVGIREGQAVTAGQELFRLDSRSIEATIRQLEADRDRYDAMARTSEAQAKALDVQAKTAQSQTAAADANVKTAETNAMLAQAQFKRYEALAAKEFITREQLDQLKAAAESSKSNLAAMVSQAEATRSAVEAAKANAEAARVGIASALASRAATEASIENAKVSLSYTVIRSPLNGQAGSLLVKAGDYVKGNGDTLLVVLNQINPILIRFSLPENLLGDLQDHMKLGEAKVTVQGPNKENREGKVVFIDNTVDRATGTIVVKATLENHDSLFWPGQFAGVNLRLYVKPNVIVVPSSAIQVGQKGTYAFIVGADQTVLYRPVKPGLTRSGVTIIEEGIKTGEKVVVDGHLKLSPGALVVEKPAPGSVFGTTTPRTSEGAAR